MSTSDPGGGRPAEPLTYRPATPADEAALRALLAAAGLPVADRAVGRQELVVATAGERVVGCAGVEVHGEDGLLRSFAVEPGRRGSGLGAELYRRVVALARARGVRTAWLLTTTIEGFCARRGFVRVPRAEAPPALAASDELRALCPATAVLMRRPLLPPDGA